MNDLLEHSLPKEQPTLNKLHLSLGALLSCACKSSLPHFKIFINKDIVTEMQDMLYKCVPLVLGRSQWATWLIT